MIFASVEQELLVLTEQLSSFQVFVLQTVNQRPSQFNTTEMNHGNHGAIIQTSSDSLMSSVNQGKTLILRDLRSFVFEISSKLRRN
jgi:hypothetical protein